MEAPVAVDVALVEEVGRGEWDLSPPPMIPADLLPPPLVDPRGLLTRLDTGTTTLPHPPPPIQHATTSTIPWTRETRREPRASWTACSASPRPGWTVSWSCYRR
jgi:hypothetical protein